MNLNWLRPCASGPPGETHWLANAAREGTPDPARRSGNELLVQLTISLDDRDKLLERRDRSR